MTAASHDAWRRHATVASHDGPDPSGGVVRHGVLCSIIHEVENVLKYTYLELDPTYTVKNRGLTARGW